MAASVFDQAHLAGLFDTGEVARLFSANAEIRAMLVVEGALAKVQGAAGVIPEVSAAAIHRAALEVQVDPAGLAEATARNGVSVPALVEAFREAMQAPEHAQYMHWGATSQDIMDTAMMLRLRQAVALIGKDLDICLRGLASLASEHASTPMAARTYGQQAAPTSFGAVVASWGWPILKARQALTRLTMPVSLGGAVGTGSALGDKPHKLRKALADGLDLDDPGRNWHTDRAPIADIAHACGAVTNALAKMGEDLTAMTQAELAEVSLGGTGASSTMPQKQNPVSPSVLVAIARMAHGLEATLNGAGVHRFQRDGAAWFTEWMVLPQIVMGAAAAARHAASLGTTMQVDAKSLSRKLEGDGFLFAENLTFALTEKMSRPEAQDTVKGLVKEARERGKPLSVLARADFPHLPVTFFTATAALGAAPDEARAFAKTVQAGG
jgi:3-carboxy-cis,cis-muconate cycloisomerase